MEKILAKIKEDARRMEYQRIKINKLKQKGIYMSIQLARSKNAGGKVLTVEEIQPMTESLRDTSHSYASSWAQEVEAAEESKMMAKQVKVSSELEKQAEYREKAKKAEKRVQERRSEGRKIVEKERDRSNSQGLAMKQKNSLKDDRTKKERMQKLKQWFGDETEDEETSPSSSKSDEDETDPAGWKHIEINEKSKLKRKKQRKSKLMREKQNATKASHLLGISPVSREAINAHREGNFYEMAKKLAVEEYLRHFFKFDNKKTGRN